MKEEIRAAHEASINFTPLAVIRVISDAVSST